ncbi:MAG: hypothetical protein P4M11_08865 [Candidatus Pacebacteria bacterium]|nr:hypothetical protein [Candidatus Paceibacterota bacterium]
MTLKGSKTRVYFIEYLRSIFGNDERINSVADLRLMLDEQLRESSDISKTDVDRYYDQVLGFKKRKVTSSPKGQDLEETKGVPVPSEASFLDKCKKIGKLGPLVCKMDLKASFGNWVAKGSFLPPTVDLDDNCLDVQCRSPFGSVRANTCVFAGAWYYEVRLMTSGMVQLGWSTLQTPFTPEEGVGDNEDSYAYDGFRVLKWNNGRMQYGEAWEAGTDVVLAMIIHRRHHRMLSRP